MARAKCSIASDGSPRQTLTQPLDRQADAKQKTGVFTGSYATNPATGAQIPVFVADYVLMGYGTGAIMAVPGQDERDWEFAEAFDLPIVRTVQPPADFSGAAYLGEGPAINSANAVSVAATNRREIADFDVEVAARSTRCPTGSSPTG